MAFGSGLPTAVRYADLLATVGVARGVIGPREADRLWERHLLNSAAAADLLPREARVADVGSGAGLPGIPLALARPDLDVVLLEPLERRARFLAEVGATLQLSNVTVHRGRAEEHRAAYDVVVARALAPLPRLLQWTWPLVAPGGLLLAWKGRGAEREVAALGSRPTDVDGPVTVVRRGGSEASPLVTVVRLQRRTTKGSASGGSRGGARLA